MKIRLYGEGLHDIGDPDHWDERLAAKVALDGWLQVIVRSIRGPAGDFETEASKRPRLLRPAGRSLGGHSERARSAKFYADEEGYDAVIFMVDADSNDPKRWREIVGEIDRGFAALPHLSIAAIACVPMSASEAWLLADPQAWWDIGLIDLSPLPRRPETIWGQRDDPDGNHPHRCFARICGDADVTDSRETRVAIMGLTDLGVLAQRCPVSFPPFQAAVAGL